MAVSTHVEVIAAGAKKHDGGTILNGGNISGTAFVAKTPLETVKGRKVSGGVVFDNDNIALANSNGKLAFFPSTRTATNTGFLMRGGVGHDISGISGLNPIAVNGSDNTSRRGGNIHKFSNHYLQGTWSDTTFDIFTGTLTKGTGAGNASSQGADHAADIGWGAAPRNGEFVILQNFVNYTGASVSGDGSESENLMDYSAITGG